LVALEASESTEDIRKACDAMFKGWQVGLAHWLEKRNIDNGLEKSEQFYALLEGGFILSKAHRDTKYLEQQKKLIKMILKS
jgi:TetR/AcrR family transcriptional repressor of lmrAB and yxaGH operons